MAFVINKMRGIFFLHHKVVESVDTSMFVKGY